MKKIIFYLMLPLISAQSGEFSHKLINKYCVDCHDDITQDGDIRLDNLTSLKLDNRLDLLNRVQEQLFLKSMPPRKKKKQPSDQEREELFKWVSSELKKHHASKLEEKLLKPQYGNYIDHEKLFSGEIKEKPYSPSRIWRRNPYHFEIAKRTYFGEHKNPKKAIGEIDNLKQPFNEGASEGVSDFAALFYADSATFDTLYRNAGFLVDRTLLMAYIEFDYKSQGKTMKDWEADRQKVLEAQAKEIEEAEKIGRTTRYIKEKHRKLNYKYSLKTPQVYREIILGNGNPAKSQIEAAIKFHYHRTGQHEPTSEELKRYGDFMQKSIAKHGPYYGLRNVLIAILVSPEYIYRSEIGLGKPVGDGRYMLAPAELAYAISYALTDSKPDEQLISAVKKGRLSTREDVKREVERILHDSRMDKPRILRFFHEFFGYHHAPKVFKDDKRFIKNFTLYKVAKRYVEDTDIFVKYILRKDKDVFKELLTSKNFFIGHDGNNQETKEIVDAHNKLYDYFKDRNLEGFKKKVVKGKFGKKGITKDKLTAKDIKFVKSLHPSLKNSSRPDMVYSIMKGMEPFVKKGITPFTYNASRQRRSYFDSLQAYNISGFDWSFPVEQPFVLDKDKRAGILTHPSWLIAHSLNTSTDPVKRGKWVREFLLAGTVPDVPITVDASIPEDHNKTLRQRFAVTEAKECWNCHKKMNPLGYTFEIFDDFGRWRDKENMEGLPKIKGKYQTKPINSKGYLDGTGDKNLDGEVEDAIDLVHRLAKSSRVQQSFIRHAFRYWMGRNEFLSDSKTLINAEKAYMENSGSFKAMLISLLTSDSFIYRKRQ